MDADVFCSLVNFCDVKDLWLVLLDNLYQLVGEKDGKGSLIGLSRLVYSKIYVSKKAKTNCNLGLWPGMKF